MYVNPPKNSSPLSTRNQTSLSENLPEGASIVDEIATRALIHSPSDENSTRKRPLDDSSTDENSSSKKQAMDLLTQDFTQENPAMDDLYIPSWDQLLPISLLSETLFNKGAENDILNHTDRLTNEILNETTDPMFVLPAYGTNNDLKSYLYSWADEPNQPADEDREGAVEAILGTYERLTQGGFERDEDPEFLPGVLNLSGFNLTKLPVDIFQLTPFVNNLTFVDMRGNQLTTLPPEIGKLVNLEVLDLTANELSTLPAQLGNLTQLQELYLGANNLNELPFAVSNLRQLNTLHIESNELTTLPTWIDRLTKLQDLNLSNNELSRLPAEFNKLSKLKRLDLGNNDFSSFPAVVGELSALKDLDLSYNPDLSTLPIEMPFWMNLSKLNIVQTAVDETAIEFFNRLNTLELSYNEIIDSPETALSEKLLNWHNIAGISPVVELSCLKNSREITQVIDWLNRLEGTPDFADKQIKTIVAQNACGMLKSVTESSSFKEIFFNLLAGNLHACEDRSAMLFNMLYTEWRLERLDSTATLSEKLKILTSGSKTQTLRNLVRQFILKKEAKQKRPEKESVEIFLYYETTLKDKLQLLSAIQTSSFANSIGPRKYINTRQLIAQVQDSYFSNLCEMETFKKLFEASDDSKIANKIKEAAGVALEEAEKTAQTDGEYLQRSKEITTKCDFDIKNLMRKWYDRELQ